MEIKKSPEADLESLRLTWWLVGVVVALAALFIAFEWTEQGEPDARDDLLSELFFEEELDVPVVEHPVAPPPPAPALAPPVVVEDRLTVVKDDAEKEDSVAVISGQAGEETDAEGGAAFASVPSASEAEEAPYVVVDVLPEFPQDGLKGLMRYLTRYIRYPQRAWQQRLQGTVLCQFIVNADGSIGDVQVLQGVHPWLDDEAVRVLRGMPRWKPGRLKGKAVRVRYTLPVVFELQ